MIKLCVFDFDSTLVCEETIDELASAYGVGEQVRAITQQAMASGRSFYESITARVALLRGMDIDLVNSVCQGLHPTNGAYELIEFLHSKNIKSIVFSGGFYNATDYFRQILGYDESFANTLEVKDGKLTGAVHGQMLSSDAKGIMLSKLKNILALTTNEILCVGDGANDIAMFEQSGLRVAFCAKEILKQKADICIDTRDMKEIIKVIK